MSIYVEYSTPEGRKLGAHILWVGNTKVLYMKNRKPLLRKYNAYGIQKKLIDWCHGMGVGEVHFESELDGCLYTVPLSRLMSRSKVSCIGGREPTYYLPLELWTKGTRNYEVEWTDITETVQ